MKISRLNFLILSLSAVSVCFPYSAANAGLRVNNSSLMKNQMQVSMERSAMQNAPQPVRTITNDDGSTVSVSSADMDACNAIYPGGAFDWVKPTAGTMRGGPATCAALVELRSYQNAAGTSYAVLAQTYLAAGDAMKCNIDEFSDITLQGRDFVYPADAAPTIEDVEKVMAQENKSNAGFKILAATLVGGLGGNLLGQNDAGKDSALGLDKDKLKMTAIGAAGGAALMTASTQVNDYKTGSVILSTGVNATAGAVAGNLMASGDDVIKIAPCKINDVDYKHCLFGSYSMDSNQPDITITWGEGDFIFLELEKGRTYRCSRIDEDKKVDRYKPCRSIELADVKVLGVSNYSGKCEEDHFVNTQDCKDYVAEKVTSENKYKPDIENILEKDPSGTWVPITSAKMSGSRVSARIPLRDGFKDKAFGYTREDWRNSKVRDEIVGIGPKVYDVYGKEIKNADVDNKFRPAMQSADDGDVVDLGNKARAKSTLIGAGGGAALGAISGAAGADTEIQQRYVTALREYEDSLGNISCSTGNRYLSKYNDIIMIPVMKTNE